MIKNIDLGLALKGVLLLCILCPTVLLAQQKIITRGNQQWIQYYNQIRFGEHGILVTDGGFRMMDGFGEPSQYILRAGVVYSRHP